LGAPRIHGELILLGFDVSEPTVSRYLQRLKRAPDESKATQWVAFLNNHRAAIAAFDFFTVPNLWFRTLYCFFAIEHERRRILHCNVTFHQRAIGSCNSYGKHSRCRVLIDMFCSTITVSSELKFYTS
jgi:hypothetical protein